VLVDQPESDDDDRAEQCREGPVQALRDDQRVDDKENAAGE
jgi:hypothetical protein